MLNESRKRLGLTKCLILITVFLASSTCLGQSKRGEVVTQIPFPFVVATRALPPGQYTVTPIGETSLRICAATNQGVIFQTHRVESRAPQGATKVVFHRYGGTYFLSELWVAGNDIGSQLPTSAAEVEMAKRTDKEVAVLLGSMSR